MVADGNVVATTGISDSMPMMLTLIEAVAGRAKAEAVGRDLGLADWDARHSSEAFRLNRRDKLKPTMVAPINLAAQQKSDARSVSSESQSNRAR
jgi:transcriptional regulator GlxA family with amidase domain